MPEDVDTATSLCFMVSVDKDQLGAFSSCEGLGCEIVMESREEGGNNDFVRQFPTRIRYPNIKLTRPLGPETKSIATWIASMATGFRPRTATIVAMTSGGREVARWNLDGVLPVRWTGPSLSADSVKIVTETVEISHHGFLSGGGD